MKCKAVLLKAGMMLGFAAVMALSWSCNESLPTYNFPANVMNLNVVLAEQMSIRVAPPGYQRSQIVLEAQNVFDEVFYDSVDIRGSIRIWWKRQPQRYVTLTLTADNLSNPSLIQNGKLMLLPGQKITMTAFWDMKSSDSVYLPYEMDFTYATLKRVCNYNVICSDPEVFVVESSLTIYDKLGAIVAAPVEYTFVGTKCRNCGGGGPYCPPGHGC